MKYQTLSLLIVFWCERRDLLRSHSKGDIFTCEDNYQVFARKLTWYFIVFLYNKFFYHFDSFINFSWFKDVHENYTNNKQKMVSDR